MSQKGNIEKQQLIYWNICCLFLVAVDGVFIILYVIQNKRTSPTPATTKRKTDPLKTNFLFRLIFHYANRSFRVKLHVLRVKVNEVTM